MNFQLNDLTSNYENDCPYIDNHKSKLPTIIVPDIHARWDFVDAIFSRFIPGEFNILFTGDILHSEGNNYKWIEIRDNYHDDGWNSAYQPMYEEWFNSFLALHKILEKQKEFPNNVFFLRGNHDDISCKLYGDYGKYCWPLMESKLFRQFGMQFEAGTLNAYYKFEKKIPYLYIGPDFIASHAIPDEKVKLKDLKLNNAKTHALFAWPDNTNWSSDCLTHFDVNLRALGQNADYWFCGHRPVKEPDLVRVQCNGKLVQNNHPRKWVIIEKPLEGPYVPSLLSK